MALATVASPFLGRRARRVAWVLAGCVCLARIYVGAHLPFDVLGGAALGWAAGALVLLVFGAPTGQPSLERVAGRCTPTASTPPTCSRCRARTAARRATWSPVTPARPVRVKGRLQGAARQRPAIPHLALAGPPGPAAQPARRPGRPGGAQGVGSAGRGGRRAGPAGAAGAVVRQRRRPARPAAGGRPRPHRTGGERLTEPQLDGIWRQVAALRAAGIAHRDLGLASVVLDGDGRAWLVDFDRAEAAAGDRLLDQDVATLLAALARVADQRWSAPAPRRPSARRRCSGPHRLPPRRRPPPHRHRSRPWGRAPDSSRPTISPPVRWPSRSRVRLS